MQWWAQLAVKLASITDNTRTKQLALLTLNRQSSQQKLQLTANFLYMNLSTVAVYPFLL